jgi:patatin-like phospholipase/acyl hydrolase
MAVIMTGLAIAGTVASIGGIVQQGLVAKRQKEEAAKLNAERPEYEIPEAKKQELALHRKLASQSTLPGQAQMEDKLGAATATGIGAARSASGSASDIIAAASGMAGNQTRSLNDLTIAGAQMQRGAQNQYGRSLAEMGRYQDQEFNLNQMIPYENAVNKKESLIAARDANIAGVWKGAGDLANTSAATLTQGGVGGGGGAPAPSGFGAAPTGVKTLASPLGY